MSNILILNFHQPYPFAKGALNAAMVDRAQAYLEGQGHDVKIINTIDPYDADEQVDLHVWADSILMQTPVYSMGVPWTAKKYIDEVYTAGMDGRLCTGDGRSRKNPTAGYGSGGTQQGTKFMFSLTFNAPKEAFNNEQEYLFQGKSVDDLFLPCYMNLRFFGMERLETFVCHDVVKNPTIEEDFRRYEAHLARYFAKETPKETKEDAA